MWLSTLLSHKNNQSEGISIVIISPKEEKNGGEPHMESFPDSLQRFTATFVKCKNRAQEGVQSCSDAEGKQRVRRLLDEMDVLRKEVVKAARNVAGK